MLKYDGKMSSTAGKRVAASALIALAAALVASCGGGSAETVSVPTVPPPTALVTKALYQVALVNAVDNTPITDPLTVTFNGAPKIVDTQGNVLNGTSVTTTTGELSLGAEYTATDKEFTVQAGNRALGWTDTGTRIVGQAGLDQTQTILIKLLNVKAAAQITADPTKAISSASTTVENFAAPTTVTSVPKSVTTTDGTVVQMGTASVAVPAGITAVDPSTGAKVTVTGAITVTTTAYSPQDVNALTAFPGGFAASIAASPGVPASTTSTFITGGFAQFNMTDSTGKALKQFDKPLTLTIDLPKVTLDESGNAVRAGTTFPVWSYDDVTGAWKFERDGLIQEKSPVDPNNFKVVFESNHLSSWNLDYRQATCTGRINLTRGTDTRPLRVSVTGIPGRAYAYETNNIKDGFINVNRSPTNPLNVKVYDGTTLVGQSLGQSICNGVTIALNLPVINQGGLIVNVTESCANGTNQRAYPTFVSVRRPGTLSIGRYTVVSGAVATSTFTDILSGAVTFSLFNKYTKTTFTQAATIPVGSSATVSVNLPNVPCNIVSGGG